MRRDPTGRRPGAGSGAAKVDDIRYNRHVAERPRRRLRSASVQLGALTALALALSGCNMTSDDDDDDCALGPIGGGETVALAARVPTVSQARTTTEQPPVSSAVPERGGFGTHLASCGG